MLEKERNLRKIEQLTGENRPQWIARVQNMEIAELEAEIKMVEALRESHNIPQLLQDIRWLKNLLDDKRQAVEKFTAYLAG